MKRPRLHRDGTAAKSAWGLLEQGVGLVAALLTATLLASTVGPAAYGAYAGVYALMGPFLAFMQGGLGLAVLDKIVREQRPPEAVARAFMGMTLSMGPVVAAVVSVLAAALISGISALAAALFVFGELLVSATLAATTSTVQATKGFIYAARVRTIVMSNKIVVLVVLAATGHLTVEALAIAQTATFALVGLAIVRWQSGMMGFRLRPGRFGREQLAATGVYAIGISASGVQNQYDQTVMSNSHPGDDGRYAAAYRIVSLGLLPLSAIANATHTDFLEAGAGLADQMRKARRFAVIGLAYSAVFCGVTIAAAGLVPRILGDDYSESVEIIRWLVPLVPLRGITTFPMNGLLGLGRNRLRTQLLVGGAVISLGLYLALIPAHSWRGAVAGTLIGETLLFVAAWTALFRAQATARRAQQVAAGDPVLENIS